MCAVRNNCTNASTRRDSLRRGEAYALLGLATVDKATADPNAGSNL